jgi:hypothetical protein
MTRVTVHEYAAALRLRYRAATKGIKGKILDEFCRTTGMHRKAAIRLLRKPTGPRLVGRGRPRRYGPQVATVLAQVWEVGDRMCGKLLAAVMPHLLAALERHGELELCSEVRALLLQASPSTIDRLLRRHRTGGAPPAQASAAGHHGPQGPGTHQDLERVDGCAARLPPG